MTANSCVKTAQPLVIFCLYDLRRFAAFIFVLLHQQRCPNFDTRPPKSPRETTCAFQSGNRETQTIRTIVIWHGRCSYPWHRTAVREVLHSIPPTRLESDSTWASESSPNSFDLIRRWRDFHLK